MSVDDVEILTGKVLQGFLVVNSLILPAFKLFKNSVNEGVMIDASNIVVASSVVLLLAGLPGCFIPSLSWGQRIAAALSALAAAAGIPSAIIFLLSRTTVVWELAWGLPFGPARISLDPLSAFFLLPVFLIAACGAIYAVAYRPATTGYDRFFTFLYALLPGSMTFVLLAGDAILFLVAWEFMALSCYFLLIADHEQDEVRDAGTLYLIATHTGTLVLIAMFAVMHNATGSFALPAAGSLSAATPVASVIFLLALTGFGAKAGLMPLHVWLPSAHANAPSHASAIMSGVILKMGVYGIVRTVTFFDTPLLWWGILLLLLGTISAVAGVAFALGQHDIKRLLAYHSIENVGIICMGIGTGIIGLSLNKPLIALLGFSGGLLHVLNHAIFKALLFFGAGAVIHASGSREIDRAGGLIRVMPVTAFFFLVGALAICGLPPLNGFVSELFVYLALFRQVIGGSGMAAAFPALAIPALALVGGLAVACFVKVFGVVFLGAPRKTFTGELAEPAWPMLLPMGILAFCCLVIGIAPALLSPVLDSASSWHPVLRNSGLELVRNAPLGWLTIMGLVLAGLVLLLYIIYRNKLRSSPCSESETWGCGYLAPAPRMQYTASSFADSLVLMLAPLLRPETHRPEISGLAPSPSRYSSHVPEAVLELVMLPLLRRTEQHASILRQIQHGRLQIYMLYIVIVLLALMAWALL